MRLKIGPWLVATLALAVACGEAVIPPVASVSGDELRSATRPPAFPWSGGSPSLSASLDVEPDTLVESQGPLPQAAPGGEALESYRAWFWVPNWRSSTLSLEYAEDDDSHRAKPFLRMVVPRGAFYRWPSGRAIGRSDWVPIGVRVDPDEVLVHFEPSGLQFTPACPVLLEIFYGDALGDGVGERERAKLKLWHRETGGDWTVLSAEHSPREGWFKAHICGFSSYQISY